VQRKLGKVLAEELVWSSFALPLSKERNATLHVLRAQLVAPWLQLALTPRDVKNPRRF